MFSSQPGRIRNRGGKGDNMGECSMMGNSTKLAENYNLSCSSMLLGHQDKARQDQSGG